jgi:hypothetical protein
MTTDIFDENAYNHALKEPNLSAEELRWIRECREHPFRHSRVIGEALREVDIEVERRRRALEARDWWENLGKESGESE